MKRETRANWWFIVIFLIVTLPGAVILFIKKMDPTASRFDQPEGLLTSLPYMAPFPAPPDIKWIVPPKTLAWLRGTMRQGGDDVLSTVPPGPEWEPAISGDHLVQLMGFGHSFGDPTGCLLVWDGSLPTDPAAYRVTMTMPGTSKKPELLEIVKVESIAVPTDVRRELVALGFVKPPEQVLWVEVKQGWLAFLPKGRFTIDCPSAARPLHSGVDIPVLSYGGTTRPAQLW